MNLSIEQRLAINFCFKPGRSATKPPQIVNAAYGDQAISRSNAVRWYGREEGEDHRIGRTTECRNGNNVDKISQLLLQNNHISLRILAEEVNIGKDM
jgi:hypothetical protein